MKTILTWVKPTWNGMHLGNYLWMFRPFVENAKWKKAFMFIPDFHSLTSVHNKETLEHNKKRLLIEIFSLLPEDTDVIVFEQSKVKNINNISWILSSVTPYSLMLRAHAFKDSQAKNSDINMAVFNYPILMAADIIAYDTDLVPVWKDQKQHLEFTRDIAENFNKNYWVEFFKLPDAHIEEDVWTIPWTDWRKMSKSYDNFIWIFDEEKVLRKKVMSIVTDDKPLEAPKDPETCNIFALIKFFGTKEQQTEIKAKYKAGNYWYWHAKQELLDILLDYFKPARERYKKYEQNYEYLLERLEKWNTIANEIVDKKYKELVKIVGL